MIQKEYPPKNQKQTKHNTIIVLVVSRNSEFLLPIRLRHFRLIQAKGSSNG